MVYYPPKLSRGASLMLSSTATDDSDLVEDSEPERVAAKKIRKELRKKKRDLLASAKLPEVALPNRGQNLKSRRSPSIIVVDSDEDATVAPAGPSRLESSGPHPPRSSPEFIYIDDTSRELSATSPPATQSQADEEPPAPSTILGIAHLAYSASGRNSTRSSSLASGISDVPAKVPKQAQVTKKSRLAFSDPSVFKDVDYSRLTKCVSCKAVWTVRKSGPAKAEHIRKCTKGFSVEQVKWLLEQGINEVEVNEEAQGAQKGRKKKAKGAEPTAPAKPSTYLENVVQNLEPKRRRRGRLEATTVTVQPMTSTRDAILDRAKMLLGDPPPIATASNIPSVASFSTLAAPVVPVEDPSPPPTQTFAQSEVSNLYPHLAREEDEVEDGNLTSSTSDLGSGTLMEEYRKATLALFDSSESESSDPTTTRVSPSPSALPSLGFLINSNMSSIAGSSSLNINTRPTRSPSTRTNDRDLAQQQASRDLPLQSLQSDHASSSETSHLSPELPKKRGRPSSKITSLEMTELRVLQELSDDDPWNDRSGCLRWEEMPDSMQKEQSDVDEQEITEALQQLNLDAQSVTLVPQPKKRGRPKKVRSEEDGPVSPAKASSKRGGVPDSVLYDHLRSKVLQDETLHLRILRYEPIKFDDILTFVRASGFDPEARGMRRKIRNFLDLACINFYGADIGRQR